MKYRPRCQDILCERYFLKLNSPVRFALTAIAGVSSFGRTKFSGLLASKKKQFLPREMGSCLPQSAAVGLCICRRARGAGLADQIGGREMSSFAFGPAVKMRPERLFDGYFKGVTDLAARYLVEHLKGSRNVRFPN